MSPEPAEEPGSERGAPSDGGALHSGQDQRSESQEGSIGGRPNGQVSTQQNAGGQEESSSNMSRVTDQVIEPDHEVESPEFVSFEGEILDTNVETKVWLVRKDDSRMLLATYTGWRTRLLDPFDLPQARGYALTDRRQAFCIFPREESRVVNDRWPINIGRNMEKPWHGNVTFYESKEAYDPYQLFGQVTSARRLPGTTPANERLGGSSAPSSSSRPTGGHRGNGGNGGTHTHQHGGPAESLQKNGAAQLALEFPMDATDDDGQWHEINDVEMNDVPDDRMVRHVNMAVESQSRGEVLMAPKKNQRSAAASSIQSFIYAMMNAEDKDDQTSRRMGTQKCEKAWNRLVMALVLLMQTTRQQMVLDYMQKKGMEHEAEETENVGEKFKKQTKVKGKVTRAEWIPQGIGKPLKRSEAQKYWEKEPKECQHPAEYLRCRANRFDRWWVCLTCGSRWERFDTDHSTSSTTTKIPEAPNSQSLKTVTGTYPQFLPAPRSKPDQGAVTLKVDNKGKIAMVPGDTGSTTSRRSTTRTPETARDRSLCKERKMTGLRAAQPAKRVPHFMLDREDTLENVEDALEQTEVLMLSDVDKEEWSEDGSPLLGPPHAD
eukprot:s4082_g3.t1